MVMGIRALCAFVNMGKNAELMFVVLIKNLPRGRIIWAQMGPGGPKTYIFFRLIASTRMIYMLFALLVFVVTVGCIVGIRWEIWSYYA